MPRGLETKKLIVSAADATMRPQAPVTPGGGVGELIDVFRPDVFEKGSDD